MSKRLVKEATVRRVYKQPEYESFPTQKMTRTELDDSSQRLARVPQKYSSLKSKPKGTDSFASGYFANNPDVIPDKRSPEEKLEEIEIKLSESDLDDNDRFNLLIQKKSLCSLAYGENSVQELDSLVELGKFYNEQNRPESALRNLNKANQIANLIDIDDESRLSLAIELATSNIDARSSRTEQQKQILAAHKAIKETRDIKTDNQYLLFKRDQVLGRIYIQSQNYDKAIKSYKKAMNHLDEYEHGPTQEKATLYNEMGKTYRAMKKEEDAVKMYQQAYDTFTVLGMVDSAEMIAPNISKDYARKAQHRTILDTSSDESTSTSISSQAKLSKISSAKESEKEKQKDKKYKKHSSSSSSSDSSSD